VLGGETHSVFLRRFFRDVDGTELEVCAPVVPVAPVS